MTSTSPPQLAAILIVFLVLLAARLAPAAQPATQPQAKEEAAVEALINQLDNPDPDVRRAASLRMNSLGAIALGPVEAALKRDDLSAESRARLTRALKYIRPRAERERSARAQAQFEANAFHESYTRIGKPDQPCAADAHAAIDMSLRLGFDPMHTARAMRDPALAKLKSIIEAGCGDVLIRAMYTLVDGRVTGLHQGFIDEGMWGAVWNCANSNYPPAVKLRILATFLRAANHATEPYCELPVKLLPDLVNTPGIPPSEIETLGEQIYLGARVNNGLHGNWDKFLAELRRLTPNRPTASLLQAQDEVQDALDLRQFRLVTGRMNDQGWKEYYDKLADAGKIAERVWQTAPNDWAARLMMQIKYNEASRADTGKEFEQWFSRAMEANPDDRKACEMKLQFLSPDAHGNAQQMLDFGHACLETQNWRGGIPLVLVIVHEQLGELSDDRKEYFKRPDVWKDIDAVYSGLLLNFPEDRLRRCEYIRYAALCERWDVAEAQLRLIGDQPVISVFGSDASFRYIKRKADRLGKTSVTTRPS